MRAVAMPAEAAGADAAESVAWQVTVVSGGNAVERVYSEGKAREIYKIASNGPHFDSARLERWDDATGYWAVEAEWEQPSPVGDVCNCTQYAAAACQNRKDRGLQRFCTGYFPPALERTAE